MPEIWLTLAMCAVILVPFIKRRSFELTTITALVGLALALVASVATLGESQFVFSNMLTIDPFSQYFKILLTAFTMLVILLWWISSRRDTHVLDAPDYLCLLLGATLGMSLMASASNLLMIFIATESASFPSFALAGFRKRHRIGSEGSLKYVLFGAAASAVMIYGMSLIYGVTGSLDLGAIASAASGVQQIDAAKGATTPAAVLEALANAHGAFSPMLAVGLLAMFAGLAFKLSAVPMHFWCPDVFQGAPTEITTFLSVASKGAAVCLLVRVLGFFGGAGQISAAAVAGLAEAVGRNLAGADANAAKPALDAAAGFGVGFASLAVGIGILGAVTATWGNLVAIHQNNIKRLLAYSSIAHAGYMIMAAALVAVAHAGSAESAGLTSGFVSGAILFYLTVYLFMNLGAFTVAALVAQRTGTEDIRDYAGMINRSPALCLLLMVFLLSLFGMPGFGGFMGKVFLGLAMSKAGLGGMMLIVVLLINTLLSFYYYIRPVYYMTFTADTEGRLSFVPRAAGMAMMSVCAVAVVATGLNLFGASSRPQEFGQLKQPGASPPAAVTATVSAPGSAPVVNVPALTQAAQADDR